MAGKKNGLSSVKNMSMDQDERDRLRKQNGRRDPFLHRENKSLDGFDFDMDEFENLIDNFTPKKSIPLILNVEVSELDYFCKCLYNGNTYSQTYDFLLERALYYDRKAFNNLAKSGNGKAIEIVAKYFMRLEEADKKQDLKITIVNSSSGSSGSGGKGSTSIPCVSVGGANGGDVSNISENDSEDVSKNQ